MKGRGGKESVGGKTGEERIEKGSEGTKLAVIFMHIQLFFVFLHLCVWLGVPYWVGEEGRGRRKVLGCGNLLSAEFIPSHPPKVRQWDVLLVAIYAK